ncbi:MAG: hypothetical protein K0S79_2019, partial [Nitrospira sp.]|nr:hypothetical protein [Nitrospira sp.]
MTYAKPSKRRQSVLRLIISAAV